MRYSIIGRFTGDSFFFIRFMRSICVNWHSLSSISQRLREIASISGQSGSPYALIWADIIALGDIDNDGTDDILMRSMVGQIVQFFRQPNELTVAPEFPPDDPVPDRFNFPWSVYTLTEFTGQEPEAIAIGDLTGPGGARIPSRATRMPDRADTSC